MLIAQYHYVDSESTCIFPVDFELNALKGAVRISEPVEVDFKPRDAEEVAQATRTVIDMRRAKLTEQLAKLERGERVLIEG